MLDKLKQHKRGILGTTIFHVVIAIIIIFLGFSAPWPPPGEEGILISFGTDDEGFGTIDPPREEVAQMPTSPSSVPASETEEAILTQDFEEAPVVTPPEEAREQEEVAPEERPDTTTGERITEEVEVKEEVEERVVNPNALYPGRSVTSDTGTSVGDTSALGRAGAVTGSPESASSRGEGLGTDGVSYSLDGRNPLSLPLPEYNYQVEGTVVVEVTVNRDGQVTNATPGVRGSTTLHEGLLDAARRAAMKARFDVSRDAPAFQRGTITYRFRLQ